MVERVWREGDDATRWWSVEQVSIRGVVIIRGDGQYMNPFSSQRDPAAPGPAG